MVSGNENIAEFQIVAMEKVCLLIALLYLGMFLVWNLRVTLNLHSLKEVYCLSII